MLCLFSTFLFLFLFHLNCLSFYCIVIIIPILFPPDFYFTFILIIISYLICYFILLLFLLGTLKWNRGAEGAAEKIGFPTPQNQISFRGAEGAAERNLVLAPQNMFLSRKTTRRRRCRGRNRVSAPPKPDFLGFSRRPEYSFQLFCADFLNFLTFYDFRWGSLFPDPLFFWFPG